jgi:hypothetical protein
MVIRTRYIILFLFLSLIGTIVCLIFFAFQYDLRTKCFENNFEIAYLLNVYKQEHGNLPPIVINDNHDNPMHSWRVIVIPNHLFDKKYFYNFNEPWNSPINKTVQPPDDYRSLYNCPNNKQSVDNHFTDYVAITGERSVWDKILTAKANTNESELNNKIIIIEIPKSDIYWSEPRDITVDKAIRLFPEMKKLCSHLHYITADLKVKHISSIKDKEEFLRMITIE